AIALQLAEIPERVASLVHHIEPGGPVLIHGLTGVERHAAVPIGTGLGGRLVDSREVGFLERAVDKTAARAAPKRQRAGPLQNLDALRVVEITEILNVVTEAVDKEVGA